MATEKISRNLTIETHADGVNAVFYDPITNTTVIANLNRDQAADLNRKLSKWLADTSPVEETGEYTLHYMRGGFAHKMTSPSLAALKSEAVDMAEKGWAHPEKIVNPDGNEVPFNAFGAGQED